MFVIRPAASRWKKTLRLFVPAFGLLHVNPFVSVDHQRVAIWIDQTFQAFDFIDEILIAFRRGVTEQRRITLQIRD
jgi:hypothetical protein